MGKRIDLDHLVGPAEIAQRLGLGSARTVNQWQARHAEFPSPVKVLRGGGLWDWREVRRWAIATGRLTKTLDLGDGSGKSLGTEDL